MRSILRNDMIHFLISILNLKNIALYLFSSAVQKRFSFFKLIFNFIEKTKLNVSCFKQPHPALTLKRLSQNIYII